MDRKLEVAETCFGDIHQTTIIRVLHQLGYFSHFSDIVATLNSRV